MTTCVYRAGVDQIKIDDGNSNIHKMRSYSHIYLKFVSTGTLVLILDPLNLCCHMTTTNPATGAAAVLSFIFTNDKCNHLGKSLKVSPSSSVAETTQQIHL